MKMNIKYVIFFCLLFIGTSLQTEEARKNPRIKDMHEKKWNYLVEKAQLTSQEAAIVKPIFMEYEQSLWQLHSQARDTFKKNYMKGENPQINHEELNELYINVQLKQAELLKKYHHQLRKVLSPKTLFNYYQAEQSFKRQLLRHMPKQKDKKALKQPQE